MTRKKNNVKMDKLKRVLGEDDEFLEEVVRDALEEVLEEEMRECVGASKGE